jgi:hypothetical protein
MADACIEAREGEEGLARIKAAEAEANGEVVETEEVAQEEVAAEAVETVENKD